MFHKNLLSNQSSTYFKIGKNLNYQLLIRSKSKFKGKKQQNFEKIIYEDKNVPNSEVTDFEENEFLPRRLSYLPDGLPQYRGKKIKWWLPDRSPITVDINPKERKKEWLDKPEYPPIVEMSTGFMRRESEERENRLKFYRSLNDLSTFDQKQFELTNLKPILSSRIRSVEPVYDYLPLYKYITRTHLIQNELPSIYNESTSSNIDQLVQNVKVDILNAIKNSIEFETISQFYEVPMPFKSGNVLQRLKKDEALIQNINNICLKQLMIHNQESDHLKESTVEFNADVRSWWWGSQFRPSANRKTFQVLKVDRINLSCQYQDYAPLNIRMNEPLEPILKQTDELVNQNVPKFPTHPFKLGFPEKFLYVANLPGFLPSLDNDNELIKTTKRGDFPFLTFLNRELINLRNEANLDDFNDDNDVVEAMAIIHNFSYLNSLAAVHGYTTYDELTYPFTNQCIITNGQYWSFFVYQMNSHSFHSDLPQVNKQNLCWSINNIKLYEKYENGKFEGLNDKVIELLIRMYLQKPKLSEAYSNLRPYLHEDLRTDEEKLKLREDLKRRFAQYKTQRERLDMLSRIVYPFEWVYIRNPESQHKFQRLLKKKKDVWPINKLQPIAHKFSNEN